MDRFEDQQENESSECLQLFMKVGAWSSKISLRTLILLLLRQILKEDQIIIASSAFKIIGRMSASSSTGGSGGGGDSRDTTLLATSPPLVPLIDIPTTQSEDTPSLEISQSLVQALQHSGFLLVRSPLLDAPTQSDALEAARSVLYQQPQPEHEGQHEGRTRRPIEVVAHPSDPKVYAMLDAKNEKIVQTIAPVLQRYLTILQHIKRDILRYLAVGLEMRDCEFFVERHDENNDTLRLISYPSISSTTDSTSTATAASAAAAARTGNRCKEHSDYGTLTLLSTDGVSGLEIFHQQRWRPVPYVSGTLVVNVGSLLSGWSRGTLCATVHRVAGPASSGSESRREDLLAATHQTRTSIAFFADPNHDVSATLSTAAMGSTTGTTKKDIAKQVAANDDDDGVLADTLQGMSIAEYITWRSGGSGDNRSGVDFTGKEGDKLKGTGEF